MKLQKILIVKLNIRIIVDIDNFICIHRIVSNNPSCKMMKFISHLWNKYKSRKMVRVKIYNNRTYSLPKY